MNRSLALLRKAKKTRPDDFKPGKSKKTLQNLFSQLPFKLPDCWVDILAISSSGTFGISDEEYKIIPLEACVKHHKEIVANRKSDDEDYNGGFIYFGSTICGDLFAFKKNEDEAADDCPVVLISHEDYSITREWESVADFLDSILLDSP